MLIEESENLHTDKILTVASVQSRDKKRPGHEIRHFCDNKAITQQLRREKTPDKSFTFTSLPCGGVTAHGHGFYIPFVVKSGTPLYVPLIGVDDSPPVLGTFPTTARAALDYFFKPDQLGGQNWVITVDGRSTAVGPEFLAGPVT